jgi:hypothetical protein
LIRQGLDGSLSLSPLVKKIGGYTNTDRNVISSFYFFIIRKVGRKIQFYVKITCDLILVGKLVGLIFMTADVTLKFVG